MEHFFFFKYFFFFLERFDNIYLNIDNIYLHIFTKGRLGGDKSLCRINGNLDDTILV